MIFYLRLTHISTNKKYCVESNLDLKQIRKNIEPGMVRLMQELNNYIHGDTIDKMRDNILLSNIDRFMIEFVPNSCVKKLFGISGWSYYKPWPL
jgi:hypothetical protein